MIEVVDGKQVRIRFDGARCIHSRACVLGLPEVFVANVEGEWIRPDAATPEDLVAIASRCPSGAIAVERLDGGAGERPSGRNVIAVLENGPLAARGALRIAGSEGLRATLCRCGASKNKPYCDGSHVAAGFVASGELPAPEALPAWGPQGPLEVTPLPDGPLKVSGAHEVTCGTGRAARRAEQAFLCRCGASKNKPYCDGTHRAIGFDSGGR